MTRSLTFKWTLTLLLSSLTGIILVGMFAYRTTLTQYDQLRVDQAKASFVANVTNYYQQTGSWVGVSNWVHERHGPNNAPPGNKSPQLGPPQFFALADASGRIVSGSGPFHV